MGESTASICSKKAAQPGLPLFLLAAVLFAAGIPGRAQGQSAAAQAAHPPGPPVMASLFFCTSNDVQCRTKINEFVLEDVRDLFVFSAWKHVSGEHVQELRFYLPDGNLYQSIETKFTTDPNGKKAGVKNTVRSRDDSALSVALPVAGTHITQRSLSGEWKVDLLLDGKRITSTTLILKREQP